MVIHFCPGKLGTKLDYLTCHWDLYCKEGDSGYASANPHNFQPVFTSEHLSYSLRTNSLYEPLLWAVSIMNVKSLHSNILSSLQTNPDSIDHLSCTSETNSRWTVDDSSLLHIDGRIFVPDSKDLRLRITHNCHNHPTAGHFGQNKTLNLIHHTYTWPNLRTFVQDYYKSCTTCRWSKVLRHKPFGLLKQLPAPKRPWISIFTDFIKQLPQSSDFTTILVIVDCLSKQSIFIPTMDDITAPQLAQLFLIHIFSKHGVPSHVTSDHGSKFVSHFFRSLGKVLNMKLHFTSRYHPEGDRQMEWVNQTLEQYLQIYCNYQQDNWSDLLPLVEIAYNNAPSVTTGVSPFFANKSYYHLSER